MAGLAFAIVAICQYFYPPDTSSPKETTNWVTPSPWLAELMTAMMWPLMTLLPASLVSPSSPFSLPGQLPNGRVQAHDTSLINQICLTNRFEHFSHESPAASTAPGAHLTIERTWPLIARQSWRSATSAGLLSYTMGLLVHVSLVQMCKNDKALLDRVMGCSLFTTTVPTIVGISLAVYSQGRWSDWWGYYEQCVIPSSVSSQIKHAYTNA